MGAHDRPVAPKRLLPRRPRWRSARATGPEYADTPGWLLLVESGRGYIDAIGLIAALAIAIRAIRRRLLGP
jgi:hypothetical protein